MKINIFSFTSPYFHRPKVQSLQSSWGCKSPEINHNAHFDFWWNDTGQSKLWLFSRITLLVNCCKSHRSFKISSYIEFSFLHYSWILKFRDTDFPLYNGKKRKKRNWTSETEFSFVNGIHEKCWFWTKFLEKVTENIGILPLSMQILRIDVNFYKENRFLNGKQSHSMNASFIRLVTDIWQDVCSQAKLLTPYKLLQIFAICWHFEGILQLWYPFFM